MSHSIQLSLCLNVIYIPKDLIMNIIMFPFDRIDKGTTIAIYGAGDIGERFLSQLAAIPYCRVGWLVDRRFKSKEIKGKSICLPPEMMDWQLPDQIVIASNAFQDEINQYLIVRGVDPARLINIGKDQEIDVLDLIKSRLDSTPAGYNWGAYYKSAERAAKIQYGAFLKPIFDNLDGILDYSNVLDFACGEGRIAEIMQERCQNLQLIDASTNAVDFCRDRFAKYPNVTVQCNAAGALPQATNSLTLVYSWDAMVHFSYKSLDFYLCEFSRVLQHHGCVVMHHSNLAVLADQMRVLDQWSLNVGGRSNVSKEDIVFIAKHHGFEVLNQTVIDWAVSNMDCISVLRKIK